MIIRKTSIPTPFFFFFFFFWAQNPSNLPLVTIHMIMRIRPTPYALRPFFFGVVASSHTSFNFAAFLGVLVWLPPPSSSCEAWTTGLHSRSNTITLLWCFCTSAYRRKVRSPVRSTPRCFWKAFRPSQHLLKRVLICRTRFSDCKKPCSSCNGTSKKYAISRSLKASGQGSCNAWSCSSSLSASANATQSVSSC
jgi:hypothetical protein